VLCGARGADESAARELTLGEGDVFVVTGALFRGQELLSRGSLARDIARGLALRHDHGSQYMSDHFQKEIAFLGIASSPAFIRAPEGNGCAERFIRTLKETLPWVRSFDTIEDLRIALLEFRDTYKRDLADRTAPFWGPVAAEPESSNQI
jgi:putative transposase